MDRKLVKEEIINNSIIELKAWRKHAVKYVHYCLKYPNAFEIEEYNFVISHID